MGFALLSDATESAFPISALKESDLRASFGCFLHPIKRSAMMIKYFIPKDRPAERGKQ